MCSFVFFFPLNSNLWDSSTLVCFHYHPFSFLLFFFLLMINQWLLKILLMYSVVHVCKFPWGTFMINVQPVHNIKVIVKVMPTIKTLKFLFQLLKNHCPKFLNFFSTLWQPWGAVFSHCWGATLMTLQRCEPIIHPQRFWVSGCV